MKASVKVRIYDDNSGERKRNCKSSGSERPDRR
jgi:hypothetical protein